MHGERIIDCGWRGIGDVDGHRLGLKSCEVVIAITRNEIARDLTALLRWYS
jgi:hypothetical protein